MSRFALTARRLAGALCLALPVGAGAVTGGLTARAGGLYTDNLTLSEDDQIEEWVGVGALGFWLKQDSPTLKGNAVAELEYRNYNQDQYGDETLFSMDAVGQGILSKERLSWWLEDYFRQAAIDPFVPPTPDNRQDANFFSTGPEAKWRIGPRHSLIAGGRYNQYYFSKSVLDSLRPSAYAQWLYDFSPRTDISFNIAAMGVDYANQTVNENYRRADATAEIKYDLVTGDLELEGGLSQIDRDKSENISGHIARLLWEYDMNSFSSVSFFALSQYTDVGQDIYRSAQRGGAVSLLNEQLISDIYRVNNAELTYRRHRGRAALRFLGQWRDEDYDTASLDRQRQRVFGEFRWGLTRLVTAGIRGWYRKDDYTAIDRKDRDTFFALILDNRLSRSLYLNVELSRRERNSNFAGESFTEDRGFLMLRYQPETMDGPFMAPQRYE
jgi:hypothetical protein